jgi:hypothetical protein
MQAELRRVARRPASNIEVSTDRAVTLRSAVGEEAS